MTEYVRPSSLDEALRARAEHPDWVVLAGGTDLMVGVTTRPDPPGLIDLFGLRDLVGVSRDGAAIRIGAATTYASMLESALVRDELPSLWQSAREVGALQIQARGTLGGNVATSSPVGDTLPCLLALDAVLELATAKGRRELAYADFLTGYRKTALAPDELLVSVRIPVPSVGTVQAWRKVGTRRAQAISKVMMAATARRTDGKFSHVRIAFGAVADRPIRVRACEAALLGAAPTAELARRAADLLALEIKPIDDVRSSAAYRLEVAQNLLARFVASMI